MLRLSGFGTTVLLLVFLVLGCAESKEVIVTYDAERNVTTFETEDYTVSDANRIGSSSWSISVRAVAHCLGPDCTPTQVRLFFTTQGGTELQLSGAGGEITADDTEIEWTSAEAGERPGRAEGELYTAQGIIATVDLRLHQLRRIASAASVEGTLGGIPLEFGPEAQSAFQNLLQKATSPPAQERTKTSET